MEAPVEGGPLGQTVVEEAVLETQEKASTPIHRKLMAAKAGPVPHQQLQAQQLSMQVVAVAEAKHQQEALLPLADHILQQ